MPRAAQHILVWSPEHDCYELREGQRGVYRSLHRGDEWWFFWLAEHASFAFQGRNGHLTLLKEPRARGNDYWYAYRSLNGRTAKKYAGRTTDLTAAHLEEVARTLASREAAQPAPAAQAPLLMPKLQFPRLSATLVRRERLLERLDAGQEHRVTLLAAPAGFGKTTLVGQWIADRRARGELPPAGWLSLDSGDNDPLRFWRYIIAACQSFQPDLGRSSLAQLATLLRPPFERSVLETALMHFLNELTDGACSGLLVLEDYHLISEPRIHETLAFWLDHLPATLHLLLLTRSEPPLPLARWRARDDLYELTAADLRFSSAETMAFLQQTAALPAQAISQLDAHLEGWAAGLRLLALTLQGRTPQEVERILSTFTGSQAPHRTLQEYFISEVLQAQPLALQDFLLKTSMLSRLTASLCDAITARNDSEHMLAMAERGNLFLEALAGSGQWYRYHALFAEAMRAEARRRWGEDELRALALKASHWYEEQGMPTEAIEAAFQAQDIQRAAGLIEQLSITQTLLEAQEYHTLCRWLEQMPEAVLRQRPLLSFSYAAALLLVAIFNQVFPPPPDTMRVEQLLQMAEEGFRASNALPELGRVFVFRAIIFRSFGRIREAVALVRQALSWLPEDDIPWRISCYQVLGAGELLEGRLDTAHTLLLEVRAQIEPVGHHAFVRANTVLLGRITFEQGKLIQAAELFQQVLAGGRAHNDLDDIADAQLGLCQISYERDDLQAAEQQAQEALVLGERLGNEEIQVGAALVLARVERARGQAGAAQQRLAALLARVPAASPQQTPLRFQLSQEIQAMQARLSLDSGDAGAVERWQADRARYSEELPLAQQQHQEILNARCLLAQERVAQALALLERLQGQVEQAGRVRYLLEIQTLLALAYSQSRRTAEARQLLQAVLTRACPEGYRRLFLDESEKMVPPLQGMLPTMRKGMLTAYIRSLLLAFVSDQAEKGTAPTALILAEPLSAQEQRVLRLLAAGRSNPEIASELIVSVNTVKAHVQSIYRKLNVNNRVEASEAARLLNLL